MEQNRERSPATVNISWKSDQERILNLVFGTSVTGNTKVKQTLCAIRQENDKYLFHRDQHGNVVPELDLWEFGNCSETNAWIYYAELVDTLKKHREYREFHGPTDEWLIDLEIKNYFNKHMVSPIFIHLKWLACISWGLIKWKVLRTTFTAQKRDVQLWKTPNERDTATETSGLEQLRAH
ncbi:2408_t:CDS:2 [Funneliformis geosporum]|nr:2408_t:CDS:2 [Funneliformis geosporum]